MKNRICTVMCLLVLMVSGCGETSRLYFEEAAEATEEVVLSEEPIEAVEKNENSENSKNYETIATEIEETTDCYVYVCGAVKNPGVYSLSSGSRIYQAISLAGGLREDASEDSINQAEEVADGQMIKVLTVEEAQTSVEQTDAGEGMKEDDGRVNLNTASADELMTLPGIGESKAMSILSYREERGGFGSIEELKNITGIKEGVYSKIKDYITVN